MPAKLLKCRDCGKEFAFPPGEQQSFARMNFPDPIRCRPCRDERRELKEGKRQLHRDVGLVKLADLLQKHLGGSA